MQVCYTFKVTAYIVILIIHHRYSPVYLYIKRKEPAFTVL